MKLYATITSERATKGQGGNKFIEIEVLDINRDRLLHAIIEPDTDGSIHLKYWDTTLEVRDGYKKGEYLSDILKMPCQHEFYKNNGYCWKCKEYPKGEQQKGEKVMDYFHNRAERANN